ncbi:hypothetical protein RB598_007371 [Gaeumannomyces tritici]
MSEFNGQIFAAPPPPGVTPDPNQPWSVTILLVVSAVFYPLAVATTVIRVYTRGWMVGKLSVDDYVMVLALVCSTVLLGASMNMLNWGLGKDLWNVLLAPDLYPHFRFASIIAAIFFCLATGLAKSSILLFYLRIFPVRAMRWTVFVLIFFTMGYSVAAALVNVFSCDPVRASWTLELIPTATCINRPVFYLAQAALGIATDITTAVAPLPLLRTLQLPTRRKIGVIIILTLGAFVCVVSIIRLKSLYVLLTDANLTRNTEPALMWCILELNLSIVGGNIPALKPFIKRVFPSLLGSSAAAGSGGGYSRSGGSGRLKTWGGGGGGKKARPVPAADYAHSEEYIMHERQIGSSSGNFDAEGGARDNTIIKTVEFEQRVVIGSAI